MSSAMVRRLKTMVKRSGLYCNWNEQRLARSLSEWSAYDERRKDFYGQFLRPGDTCFDVGANVGNRTKIFLRLDAKVVAVEPQETCMRVLRRAYADDRRVALVRAASGAAVGTMEMMVNTTAPTTSSLLRRWIDAVKASGRFSHSDWDATQTAQVAPLDRLIAEHGRRAFIKIDVEGFEFEALTARRDRCVPPRSSMPRSASIRPSSASDTSRAWVSCRSIPLARRW